MPPTGSVFKCIRSEVGMSQTTRDRIKTMPEWKKWLIRIVFWGVVVACIVLWPRGVGAVVAGLAVFALVVYWWIKRKIKKFLAPLQNLDLFPTEIKLKRQRRVKWHHGDTVKDCVRALTDLSFAEISCFTVDKTPDLNMFAFIKSAESMFAVVYDEEFQGVWVDLVIPFADGAYVTYTNTKHPEVFDRPPDKPIERFPDYDIQTLYQTFRQQCAPKQRRQISEDDFVRMFEEYFAQERAWQVENMEETEALEQSLQEAFLEEIGWSAIEWDRKQHRVVFIHDRKKKGELVDIYTSGLYLEDSGQHNSEEERAKTLAAKMPARAAFAAMVEQMPAARGFTKLLELTSPIGADVYLLPEPPDGWDDYEQ
jgi:hypothetical protein